MKKILFTLYLIVFSLGSIIHAQVYKKEKGSQAFKSQTENFDSAKNSLDSKPISIVRSNEIESPLAKKTLKSFTSTDIGFGLIPSPRRIIKSNVKNSIGPIPEIVPSSPERTDGLSKRIN